MVGSTAHDGANGTNLGHRSHEHIFELQVSVSSDGGPGSDSGSRLTFDTCASSFDTVLRVFDAGLITELAVCDDDDVLRPGSGYSCTPGCADATRARLSAAFAPGTYMIVLEGYDTEEGAYVLTMDCPTGAGARAGIAAPTAAPVELFLGCRSECYTYNQRSYRGQPCLVPTLSICGCGLSNSECEPCRMDCPVDAAAPAPLAGHLSCDGVVTGDTSAAGASHVHGQPSNEHHYRLAVLEPTTYTLSTCDALGSQSTGYDTWLRVIDGANYSNEVAQCDDGSAPAGASWRCGPRCGLQSRLTVALAPGAYIVIVEGYGAAAGVYTLSVTCEATGTTVSPVESVESVLLCGSTVHGSTAEPGLVSAVGEPSNEHVFGLEVTDTATAYAFDTCGSSFDTVVHVYDAGFTAELAHCDDDEPAAQGNWTCGGGPASCVGGVSRRRTQARLSVVLEPGSYRVVLEGFYTGNGAYVLSTTCSERVHGRRHQFDPFFFARSRQRRRHGAVSRGPHHAARCLVLMYVLSRFAGPIGASGQPILARSAVRR